jgi:hypothetical protein
MVWGGMADEEWFYCPVGIFTDFFCAYGLKKMITIMPAMFFFPALWGAVAGAATR